MKPLADRGFLFLLSSSHLHSSNGTLMVHMLISACLLLFVTPYNGFFSYFKNLEKRGRSDRGLQALFVCQESRVTGRLSKYKSIDII